MPRAVFLGIGAIAAALVGPEVAPLVLPVILAAAAVSTAVAIYLRRPPIAAAAIGFALVLARVGVGALLAGPVPATWDLPRDDRRWRGDVVSLAAPSDGRQRGILDLRPVGDDSVQSQPATGRAGKSGGSVVRAYARLPRNPPLAAGDRVLVRAVLRPAPAGPGFGEYLARNRITATADVVELDLDDGRERLDGSVLEGLRRDAADLLAATLPEPQAGLAAGILIGLRDRVDRDLADAFTTSGLSHILAISGWNIAIVGAVVATLLRGVRRPHRSLAVVLAVCAYTLAAGASASVVRAALMAATVLLARESGRRGAGPAALGLAACAMLLVEPATVTEPGFQLSIAATAGLLAWAAPLTERLAERLPARTPRWLVDSLGISLAAQASTLPLVLLSFGRLSLVAPVANLVAAPLVAPGMLAGLLALVAGLGVELGAPALVGAVAGTAGWAVLGAVIAVARVSAVLPFASLELPAPWNSVAAALSVALLLACGTRPGRGALRIVAASLPALRRPRPAPRSRARSSVAGGVPVAALLAAALAVTATMLALPVLIAGTAEKRLSMTVLDVGQGDAILLEGPRGGRLLVDGGPDPDRLLKLLDERLPPWDRRIDLVVLTHPHEDHVSGLALLLGRYQVGGVAEPGMAGPGPGYRAFVSQLSRDERRPRRLAAGDRLRFDGADILVRWPRRGGVPREPPDEGKGINNVSIVLDVRYGDRRLLLTGDAEQEVDPQLIAAGLAASPGARLDVLKVAHHGSGTATTETLLAALRPRVAIVSAGRDNPYGHPSGRTLARIAAAGARALRTDRDGSVTVSTNGRDLVVSSTGPRSDTRRRRSGPSREEAAGRGAQPPVLLGGSVGRAGRWTCGLRPAAATVPRIDPWPSPRGARPPGFFSISLRRAGFSPTFPPSPRSPHSSRSGSRAAGSPSTAGSWRRRLSFTTSTSSSPTTTRSLISHMARPGLVG